MNEVSFISFLAIAFSVLSKTIACLIGENVSIFPVSFIVLTSQFKSIIRLGLILCVCYEAEVKGPFFPADILSSSSTLLQNVPFLLDSSLFGSLVKGQVTA